MSTKTTPNFMPEVSICICNKNMEDTLPHSLNSVLTQLDNRYEVIVIDDYSSDGSRIELKKLEAIHSNLRVIYLSKDKNRRLGMTRNLSFKIARGKWCIFHIDTDDLIGPYIMEFERIVRKMDEFLDRDHLFSGKQIHMAKKEFLVARGPFKNIYRGEDRDLYMRLAFSHEWIIIEHKRFITRMKRLKIKKFNKILNDEWDTTVVDLQMGSKPLSYLISIISRYKIIGLVRTFVKCLFVPFAYLVSCKRGFFSSEDKVQLEDFIIYRKQNTKSFSEWKDFLGIGKLDFTYSEDVFY